MQPNLYTLQVKTESTFATRPASGMFAVKPFGFQRGELKKNMIDLNEQLRTGIGSAGMLATGLYEPTAMPALSFKGHGHNQAAITDTPAALPAALGYIDALLRACFLRQSASYGYASHDLVAASGGTYTTLTKVGAGADAGNYKAGAAVTVINNDTADVYYRAFIRSSENSSGDLLITLDRNLSLTASDVDIYGAYIWSIDTTAVTYLDTKGNLCSISLEQYTPDSSPMRDNFVGGIVTKFEAVSKSRDILAWNFETSFVSGEEDAAVAGSPTAWTQPTFITCHNCNLAVNNAGVVSDVADLQELTLTIEPKAEQIMAEDAPNGVSGYVIGKTPYEPMIKAKFATTAALRTAYKALVGSATRVAVSAWISSTVMGTTNSPAGNVFGYSAPSCQVADVEITDDEQKNMTVTFRVCEPASGNNIVISLA